MRDGTKPNFDRLPHSHHNFKQESSCLDGAMKYISEPGNKVIKTTGAWADAIFYISIEL